MKERDIIKGLDKFGFSLFSVDKSHDANIIIAEIIKTRNMRFWEGFPVVLANIVNENLFDYKDVKRFLKRKDDKLYFDLLIIIALSLYQIVGSEISALYNLKEKLYSDFKVESKRIVRAIQNNEDFKIKEYKFSSERLRNVFENYLVNTQRKIDELIRMEEECDFEFALNQIFSCKQKDLFIKKIKREKLTKTEKEYYSRVVKKKILALANSKLHKLCQKMLVK